MENKNNNYILPNAYEDCNDKYKRKMWAMDGFALVSMYRCIGNHNEMLTRKTLYVYSYRHSDV